MELVAFLEQLAAEKLADPADDVVSLLVGSEVDGRRLSPAELVTFNMSLLVAGNETTRHLISGGMMALAEHPDQRREIAGDPGTIPLAVEECLRWVTPIQQFARTATRDTTIGDSVVAEGDYLVMLYASGNRDEAASSYRRPVRRTLSRCRTSRSIREHRVSVRAGPARGPVVFEGPRRYPRYEIVGEPSGRRAWCAARIRCRWSSRSATGRGRCRSARGRGARR
jgi:hypothetical protein